jgi:hypothetical protein
MATFLLMPPDRCAGGQRCAGAGGRQAAQSAAPQRKTMRKPSRILIVVIAGCLFGVFVFLPADEVTSYYEYHFQEDITVWAFVIRQMMRALLLQSPLKLLLYLVLGGGVGVVAYELTSLLRRRGAVIEHLERELGKDVAALIRNGEDDNLEFKSSFRYDYQLQKVNKTLEGVIIKTLAGFMNARGGSLLIGVADDGSIVGLENDYQTLQRKDSDGYTQSIMSTVAERLGTPACRMLRILFHELDGKQVCRIIILPSPVPIYAKEGKQSKFYIRAASSTREMDLQEAVGFIKTKWG